MPVITLRDLIVVADHTGSFRDESEAVLERVGLLGSGEGRTHKTISTNALVDKTNRWSRSNLALMLERLPTSAGVVKGDNTPTITSTNPPLASTEA
jgi:hypothetical protein